MSGYDLKPGDPIRHRRSTDPNRIGEVIKVEANSVRARWSWDNGKTWTITLLVLAHEVLPDERPRTEAQRAPRWPRWLDGMADTFGERYGDDDGRGCWAIGRYPDLDDGPTKGGLLQLARERHGDPFLAAQNMQGYDGDHDWVVFLSGTDLETCPRAATEGGVLIAVLEWPVAKAYDDTADKLGGPAAAAVAREAAEAPGWAELVERVDGDEAETGDEEGA